MLAGPPTDMADPLFGRTKVAREAFLSRKTASVALRLAGNDGFGPPEATNLHQPKRGEMSTTSGKTSL